MYWKSTVTWDKCVTWIISVKSKKDFAETLKNADKQNEKAEEAPELVDFEEVSKNQYQENNNTYNNFIAVFFSEFGEFVHA